MEKKRRNISLTDMRVRYVIMGLLIATLPVLASNGVIKNSNIILIGSVLIYSIAGIGVDILLGYSGLISLGTAGFMGLAAYMSAYFVNNLNWPFELSLAVSVAVPVLIGLLVGLASLRIEGIYLAIATLCVSEILRKTFEELTWFTNSFGGQKADYPVLLGSFELDRSQTFWMITIILVLVMILEYNLVNSKLGRALNTMRGSEVAASAMGVNILAYRLLAFALSAALAALAGVLYMHFINFTYPNTWILGMSLNILSVVIIGGMRSGFGTVLGAFVVFAVPDLVLKKIPVIGEVNGIAYVFNGLLIILVIILYPYGLIHIFGDIRKLLGKRKTEERKKGGETHE